MRPRIRRLRRWSFVVTLPVAALLIWLRGARGTILLPAAYLAFLGALVLLARRAGGARRELLLDLVLHPAGRRALRTELHLLATLARAVGRAFGRHGRSGEFSYHRRGSDLAIVIALVPALAAEIVAVELLLSGVTLWIRVAVAAISLYAFAWLVGWTIGLRIYPHRLGDGVLEARLGAFYRAAVPLEAIESVEVEPMRPSSRTELIVDDCAAVLAVGGSVDLRVELARPVMVERPLGEPVSVCRIHLAADQPALLAREIREHLNQHERGHDDHSDRPPVCGHE